MRINCTENLSEQGRQIIIPCLPSTSIEETLMSIVPDETSIAQSLTGQFDAAKEEMLAVVSSAGLLHLVGVKSARFDHAQKALQTFSSKNRGKLGTECTLYLRHMSDPESLAESTVNGFCLGLYDPGLYKSNSRNSDLESLHVVCSRAQEDAVVAGQMAAETQLEMFKLVNAPSNKKNPQTLAEWATESGKEYGYAVEILEENALRQQHFDGLLAVNRGSEIPARLIISDYSPNTATKTVVLVGKGVTFDTGGISIKPSGNMHYMKSDMGGAAAVLGAVELAAKMNLAIHVVGIVPTTDNSVDAKAIKPGDVIGSYSKQTIEVINTDAEGRLILADGLAYGVEKYKPDVMIDLATLTGSVVRALGTHCAGLFTNNDDLADQLVAAGNKSGERLWRLPLWEEYAEDLRSDIADIKNLGDKPMAGAITAAKFLEHFTKEHKAWAHLDVAATAFKANGVSRNHTATAFGVRLIYTFLSDLANS